MSLATTKQEDSLQWGQHVTKDDTMNDFNTVPCSREVDGGCKKGKETLLHNSFGHHNTDSPSIRPWTSIFVKMSDGPIHVENPQTWPNWQGNMIADEAVVVDNKLWLRFSRKNYLSLLLLLKDCIKVDSYLFF